MNVELAQPPASGLCATPNPRVLVPPPRVEIASDGSWFRAWPDPARSLAHRHRLRKLLAALAGASTGHGRLGLSLFELFEHAWDREKCLRHAQRNRVHVALATLRRLGLARAIIFDRGVYRLAHELGPQELRVVHDPRASDLQEMGA